MFRAFLPCLGRVPACKSPGFGGRLGILSLIVLGFGLSATAAAGPADLVVLNAKVLTVDGRFSRAEAVAIRDGVFVLVGTNADARKLVGQQTEVLDAQGLTVIPGLIETH